MKRLFAFLAAITLIGSVADIYTPSANARNTIGFKDNTSQLDDTGEMPDLEASHKTVTEGDFTFNVYEDFAFLTKFADREAEEVEIPAEINGIPVVGVDGTPFGYCQNLKTITLPDTLQYFDWFDLVCVVTRVSGNSSGSQTELHSQFTEIDEETTFNPSNVTIMADENEDDDTIYPSVAEIKVSETNPYFALSDGILYTKDMKKVIGCPPALEMTELKISEKAEIINDHAFATCYKLKSAVIPENIKQINDSAFSACINLESVELPKSINAVYTGTFYMCESLKTVNFNGDIGAIGTGAFSGCASLTEFDIPDSVTYIGTNAFEFSPCIEVVDDIHYVDNWVVDSEEDIENVVPINGTVGIAEMSFQFRENIKHVDFPESVIYVCDIAIVVTGNYPYEIHYRASYINEDTLRGAKSASDYYIYDKDCDIFDSEKTIPAQYKVKEPISDSSETGNWISGDVTITADESNTAIEKLENAVIIHGYAGSTAQAYAEKYNRKFVVIEEKIPQETTEVTTTAITSITTETTTTTTSTKAETTTVTTENVVFELVKGDANGDGKLTIADAVSLTNWIMGSSYLKLENSDAVDLCKDGKIDVFDLCLLREELVKGL